MVDISAKTGPDDFEVNLETVHPSLLHRNNLKAWSVRSAINKIPLQAKIGPKTSTIRDAIGFNRPTTFIIFSNVDFKRRIDGDIANPVCAKLS